MTAYENADTFFLKPEIFSERRGVLPPERRHRNRHRTATNSVSRLNSMYLQLVDKDLSERFMSAREGGRIRLFFLSQKGRAENFASKVRLIPPVPDFESYKFL